MDQPRAMRCHKAATGRAKLRKDIAPVTEDLKSARNHLKHALRIDRAMDGIQKELAKKAGKKKPAAKKVAKKAATKKASKKKVAKKASKKKVARKTAGKKKSVKKKAS